MAISMKELNLEQGMPAVDTALGWLEAELAAARKMGRPALKVIHGYPRIGLLRPGQEDPHRLPQVLAGAGGSGPGAPGDPGGGFLHFQRGDPAWLCSVWRAAAGSGPGPGESGRDIYPAVKNFGFFRNRY